MVTVPPEVLGVIATVGTAAATYAGGVLRRIDRRTERLDDDVSHHRRTLYGDERADDGGLVEDVAEVDARTRVLAREHGLDVATDGGDEP